MPRQVDPEHLLLGGLDEKLNDSHQITGEEIN